MGRLSSASKSIVHGHYSPKLKHEAKVIADKIREEKYKKRREQMKADALERISAKEKSASNLKTLETNEQKKRARTATAEAKKREKTKTSESKKRVDYRANKTIATEATKMHMHGKTPNLTPPRKKKKNGKK